MYPEGHPWRYLKTGMARRFTDLIEIYGLKTDERGIPIPALPPSDLVTDWEVRDPITGKAFKSILRHILVDYGLEIEDLRAMFALSPDFPGVAPGHAQLKKLQTEEAFAALRRP